MSNKNPKSDLKKLYPVFVETGFIGALLILILLANLKFTESPNTVFHISAEEGPPLILPPTTIQEPKSVPAPPLPEIPIEIPDDSPIEESPIEFAEFDLAAPFDPPHLEQVVKIEVDHERLKTIEVLPKMIGGEEALRNSIEYPKFALNAGIQGIVEVEFIVTKKGRVEDPVIVRGIGGGCDEAVLKGIKRQKFTPGVKDGKLMKFRIKETVQFIIVGTVR